MARKIFVSILLAAIAWAGLGWWNANHWPVVNAPLREGAIVALGDSLTEGIGAPRGQSYPDRLSDQIGRPVLNFGVSGDTVEDAARRLDPLLAEKPAVTIVLLGGNDLLGRKDLDQSFADLEGIIARLQASGAVVMLVGLRGLPPFFGVGGRYKELARRRGCLYVPDILRGILANPSLMADRIHPNAAGYGIMAERIAEAIKPLLIQ
jgi:acyl-CoA hydrolase